MNQLIRLEKRLYYILMHPEEYPKMDKHTLIEVCKMIDDEKSEEFQDMERSFNEPRKP